MPRFLTVKYKFKRVVDAVSGLAHFCRNPAEFVYRCISVDETWIHHYTPKTNETVGFYKRPCSEEGKDAEIDRKGHGFSDACKIIHIDNLEKKRKINDDR